MNRMRTRAGILATTIMLTSVLAPASVFAETKVKERNSQVTTRIDTSAWVQYDVADCVTLNQYSKSQLSSSVTATVKQDIIDYINNILAEYPSYSQIEKSLVQKGDYVNVDMVGYVDGETNPSINISNYTIHVGDERLPAKVENSLVGKQLSQEVNVSCKSTEYNETYGGEDAQFTIKINKIVDATFYTYDTVTEQYAKDMFGVDKLENFYKKMESEAATNLFSYKKNALYNSFGKSTIIIPKGLTAQKYDQCRQLLIHQTFGDDEELYSELIPSYTGLKQSVFEKTLYEKIKSEMPQELLLMSVARKENISAQGEDYEAYLADMIAKGGFTSREKLFDYYQSTYESGEEYIKRQYILYAVVNYFCDYSVPAYVEDKKVATIKDDDIIGRKQYAVPPSTGFKSYMDFRHITSQNSDQYQLQTKAETDYNGIRIVDGRYLIAVGTHFGGRIGQYVDIVLENGVTINCILGDIKDDKDTDENNIITVHDGSVTEFIVDSTVIPDNVKITGNVSKMYSSWTTPVKSVVMFNKYTEIPAKK